VNAGGTDALWAPVWNQIDEDFDEHVEDIRNFLRCPTVSASDDDMLAGAEYVAALIEGAGGSAEIIPTAGHPAVLGRIEGDGPRLLRYGMYDVQPADESGWSSPPFAAVSADVPGAGPSIVARGAANSKGSLASFLLALASARRVSDLPAEIVFVVDGEEELGSPSLPGVMSARRDDLSVLAQVTDRVAVMYAGRIVEEGSATELLTTPRHPYTKSLVSAFPVVGDPASRGVPTGLPGDPPDPAARPPGCAFHPRCPAAFEPCDTIDPVLERHGSRLAACHLVAEEEA
jgi:oligopeptide/dipeptide ABC transporter ATP-binding protein